MSRLSRVAWVDGNDPEHWWTLARLSAIGVTALLIGGARDHAPRIEADEELRVEAETRCGALIFQARLPSLRRMPELLRVTAEHQALAPPDLDTTKAAGAARKPVRRRAKAAA